jgi:hypothetical protein
MDTMPTSIKNAPPILVERMKRFEGSDGVLDFQLSVRAKNCSGAKSIKAPNANNKRPPNSKTVGILLS